MNYGYFRVVYTEVIAAVLITLIATLVLVLLGASSAQRFGTRASLREAWKSPNSETPVQS